MGVWGGVGREGEGRCWRGVLVFWGSVSAVCFFFEMKRLHKTF